MSEPAGPPGGGGGASGGASGPVSPGAPAHPATGHSGPASHLAAADCRVLVVDDDPGLQYTFRELLSENRYVVRTTGDPFEALKLLGEYRPHIVIVDLSMPKMSGLELLPQIKKRLPDTLAIMITAYGTEEIAVKAIKAGADDYFAKPFSNDAMLLTLRNARERLALRTENRALREEVAGQEGPTLIGKSDAIKAVLKIVEQVARTDVTVLIEGESGTGKEVLASTLCRLSPRHGKPLVKLNCAALPETLIEAELFGHEAGAFTGAAGQRKGKFEMASGGTIFLDEIGDMTLATQTKVLRVLQNREVERLGGTGVIPVDVRVITATNQNLEQRIAQGLFRSDLYYRLNVVRIVMPPLRQRKEDLPLLLEGFLAAGARRFGKRVPEVPRAILERMMRHDWPGNVRELENSVARAIVMDDLEQLVPVSGPARAAEEELVGGLRELLGLSYKEAKARVLSRFERYYLVGLLDAAGNNLSSAARRAKMHRKNFWVKIRAYVPRPDSGGEGEANADEDSDAQTDADAQADVDASSDAGPGAAGEADRDEAGEDLADTEGAPREDHALDDHDGGKPGTAGESGKGS